MLSQEPSPESIAIKEKRLDLKPYWHLERARVEGTRTCAGGVDHQWCGGGVSGDRGQRGVRRSTMGSEDRAVELDCDSNLSLVA